MCQDFIAQTPPPADLFKHTTTARIQPLLLEDREYWCHCSKFGVREMPDELEERLRSHASAFDSLLSLIPAKLYYGEDVSDQWQRKKQTPEQKRAARMAKLDPDNAKSAKDVMDEQAVATRKRKRAEGDASHLNGPTESSNEMEGSHDHQEKKRKRNQDSTKAQGASVASTDGSILRKVDKRAAKRQRVRAKKVKAKQKAETKRNRKDAELSNTLHDEDDGELIPITEESSAQEMDAAESGTKETTVQDDHHSTASSSPEIGLSLQSPPLHSVSSSISSIPPSAPSPVLESAPLKPSPPPSSTNIHSLTPQQRLEARIQALRAQRKADNGDGRAPRNRQELLEQRRRKEEERRAHKKELRRKAREEDMRRQEEEIAKRFSPGGSGSLIASPRSPLDPNNNNNNNSFSFSRVAFGDGTHAEPSLSSLLGPRDRKGTSDTGTALQAAQKRRSRIANLEPNKRQTIEKKEIWLNAKKKAHGGKVKNDTSLLKKALKRQEKGKKKSEKEWQGRVEGIAKSQESRQKKRTDNIQKRRDDKTAGSGGKSGKGKKAKVRRPGFEGSFKAKHSTGGKK